MNTFAARRVNHSRFYSDGFSSASPVSRLVMFSLIYVHPFWIARMISLAREDTFVFAQSGNPRFQGQA
jgi:hypothetical protein